MQDNITEQQQPQDTELTTSIVEIFSSLEGEGLFVGTPTIFVRFAGCNVGCKHCDSKVTWSKDSGKKFTMLKLLQHVSSLVLVSGVTRVSVTGGEPLLDANFIANFCLLLRETLKRNAMYITLNLETSGTIFPDDLYTDEHQPIWNFFDTISMDIKTPSSGVILFPVTITTIKKLFSDVRFCFKAVIADDNDLNYIVKTFKYEARNFANPLVLTPCEQNGELANVPNLVKSIELNTFFKYRVIAQQHKLCSYR